MAVAEVEERRHGLVVAGSCLGVSALQPVEHANPLHRLRLAPAVTDLAEDPVRPAEAVHRGIQAVAVQAEIAEPAQQRRLAAAVAAPTADGKRRVMAALPVIEIAPQVKEVDKRSGEIGGQLVKPRVCGLADHGDQGHSLRVEPGQRVSEQRIGRRGGQPPARRATVADTVYVARQPPVGLLRQGEPAAQRAPQSGGLLLPQLARCRRSLAGEHPYQVVEPVAQPPGRAFTRDLQQMDVDKRLHQPLSTGQVRVEQRGGDPAAHVGRVQAREQAEKPLRVAGEALIAEREACSHR